jgi:hypothetical protein
MAKIMPLTFECRGTLQGICHESWGAILRRDGQTLRVFNLGKIPDSSSRQADFPAGVSYLFITT